MKITTDERGNDNSKALPELVDDVIKSNNITTICKLFVADGASYDSNDIFRCLMDNGIFLSYQSKKQFYRVRWKKGNFFRNLSVLAQKKDLQKWKDNSVRYYGQRWIIETAFSCIKRMFGEYVYSVRQNNMI